MSKLSSPKDVRVSLSSSLPLSLITVCARVLTRDQSASLVDSIDSVVCSSEEFSAVAMKTPSISWSLCPASLIIDPDSTDAVCATDSGDVGLEVVGVIDSVCDMSVG